MINIVIVEDELIAAEYLKELLHTQDYQVLEIIDRGEEALEKIPLLSPDIVLMDIMLKDHISGSEVALKLKQTAPDVAIVFLSAYANEEMLDYAIESNTYGYMMKPYEENRILTTFKIIVSRIEKDKQRFRNKKPISDIISIDEHYVFNRILKRLFKDEIEVSLGQKSIDLLSVLCIHPNTTVSHEELSRHIWEEVTSVSMLRTQVSRTKKEMGIDVIENIKGLGYRIVCI